MGVARPAQLGMCTERPGDAPGAGNWSGFCVSRGVAEQHRAAVGVDCAESVGGRHRREWLRTAVGMRRREVNLEGHFAGASGHCRIGEFLPRVSQSP